MVNLASPTCLKSLVQIQPPQQKQASNMDKNVKNLLLRVKRIYFDKIIAKQKKIECRDCTDYWVSRLVDDVEVSESGLEQDEKIIYRKFDKVIFLCGKDVYHAKHTGTHLDADKGIFEIYFE